MSDDDMPFDKVDEGMLAAAKMMRQTFLALVLVGFTEEQAMYIVSTMLTASIEGQS